MNNILMYIIEGAFIGILLDLIIFLILADRSFILEKRITRFSISSITDKPTSFFGSLSQKYSNVISKITNVLLKCKLFEKISKRYNKYIETPKDIKEKSMDIISNKIIMSFLAIIITLLSCVLRRQSISIIQFVIAFIIGFFALDVILAIKHKQKQNQIENDFFKAVLIMSNAFKSGRSIMQAVKIVSEEIEGPVSEEFKKMYIDLTYGLDLDTVFERFSSRVNLEETKYMASSLVILNKTGGNVIKVFNSIEKSFFERRKLNDELKSVTALSDFVYKILVCIPFIISVTIYFLNPNYFLPFINTTIGNIILVIIIALYILYIFIIKKVIRIRE